MEPQNVQNPQTPYQPVAPTGAFPNQIPVTPPLPKAKSSNKIFIIIGAILGVVIVILLIVRFVIPALTGPKEIVIEWWGLWEDSEIVAPLITEYETANPGVKINYTKQSNKDYRDRLTNAMAQGQGPDIFRFHNTWVPMFVSQLDPIPASILNAFDFTGVYYPTVARDLAVGTGVVGIPLEYDALTLFINEEIFSNAGKSAPATWDELRSTAASLTIKDDRGVITQSGVALGRTENVDHWPEILALLMLQNRANLANPVGELGEKALEFFTIFSSSDKVWDETQPISTEAFAAGKLAMYFAPHWRAFEIQEKNPSLKFKTVPLPQVPKDNPTEVDISYATYWVEGVWSKSPDKEAAWKFLQFLSSKESLTKFYESAAAVRGMGEPYPRTDMSNLLVSHPVLGSIISMAPEAKSWYLASRTFDGPTGINTQLENYYKDAVNAVNKGIATDKALETAALGINQVLTQYGLRR